MNLPNGIVLPEAARVEVEAARALNQPIYLRNPMPVGVACHNCGGIGTMILQWDSGEHRFFPCPVCNPESEERMARLWESSGLEVNERRWTLDYVAELEGKHVAVKRARDMLAQAPRPIGWILFFGTYGVGKSGVLKALTAGFIRAGVGARYVRAADILSEARSTYSDASPESEREMCVRYGRYQFLAVDEVDRIGNTAWGMSFLFAILDDRSNRREMQATALATNKRPGQMGESWGYLESRMKDGERVPIGGTELRGASGRKS